VQLQSLLYPPCIDHPLHTREDARLEVLLPSGFLRALDDPLVLSVELLAPVTKGNTFPVLIFDPALPDGVRTFAGATGAFWISTAASFAALATKRPASDMKLLQVLDAFSAPKTSLSVPDPTV
jgi:hypothetical protein